MFLLVLRYLFTDLLCMFVVVLVLARCTLVAIKVPASSFVVVNGWNLCFGNSEDCGKIRITVYQSLLHKGRWHENVEDVEDVTLQKPNINLLLMNSKEYRLARKKSKLLIPRVYTSGGEWYNWDFLTFLVNLRFRKKFEYGKAKKYL